MSNLILTGDSREDKLLERRMARRVLARQYVDFVLQFRGPERWIAVQRLWLRMSRQHRIDHDDAVREAKEARENAIDKEFGRTAQTLKADNFHGLGSSQHRRLVAIMPEDLITTLKQFDPLNLAMPKGKQYRDNWRMVYKTFPEYLTVEKVDY